MAVVFVILQSKLWFKLLITKITVVEKSTGKMCIFNMVSGIIGFCTRFATNCAHKLVAMLDVGIRSHKLEQIRRNLGNKIS